MSAALAKQIRKPENIPRICARIAEGFTLRQIARELGCTHGAIVQWYAADPVFANLYAQAKEAQAERFAEEIIEISDDGSNDWMKRELEGGAIVEIPDQEHINRSRLRVDARKWLMAKMAPKRYGDKLQVDMRQEGDPAAVPYERLMSVAAGQIEPPTIEHDTQDVVSGDDPPKE